MPITIGMPKFHRIFLVTELDKHFLQKGSPRSGTLHPKYSNPILLCNVPFSVNKKIKPCLYQVGSGHSWLVAFCFLILLTCHYTYLTQAAGCSVIFLNWRLWANRFENLSAKTTHLFSMASISSIT